MGKPERLKALRNAKRAFVASVLDDSLCVSCGETDPRCLTFLHVRGHKPYEGGILTLASQAVSWGRLWSALTCADTYCLNCKARLTSA